MIPKSVEGDIQQYVAALKQDAGENLVCVVLYGSAANGEFHEEFSDVNLMLVLRDTSLDSLQRIAKSVRSWTKKQPAPLIVTRTELERSTDVFSIELLDMKQHHKVLFGDDVLSGLDVPLSQHRVQVEYELREKLILLRQRAMMATNDKQMLELLVQSVPSFSTLFRHALIALGKSAPASRRESITHLAQLVKFESASFVTVLDIRERKLDAKKLDVKDLFARYLAAVEQVVAAVDQALER